MLSYRDLLVIGDQFDDHVGGTFPVFGLGNQGNRRREKILNLQDTTILIFGDESLFSKETRLSKYGLL